MPGSVRKAQCGEGRDDNVQQTKCKTQNAKHFLQNTFQLKKKSNFHAYTMRDVSVYDYDPKS